MIVLNYNVVEPTMPVIVRATPIPILPRQALCRWLVVGQRRPGEVIGVGNVADRRGRSGAMRIGDTPPQPSLDTGRGRGMDFPVRAEDSLFGATRFPVPRRTGNLLQHLDNALRKGRTGS